MVNWIQKDLLEEKEDFKKTYELPIQAGEQAGVIKLDMLARVEGGFGRN